MNGKIKKLILVVLAAVMCVSFMSCSKNEIPLKSLKTDDIFQYTDAKWGVNPDEANETLQSPIVKDDARSPSDGSYVTYKTENNIKIDGYDVFTTFEFADNKLRQVMFAFYSEEEQYQKCFDKLSAELKKLYGDGKDVKGVDDNRSIFWLLEHTKLDIAEVTISAEPFVLISISDISQFPEISIDKLYDIMSQEGVYEVEPA